MSTLPTVLGLDPGTRYMGAAVVRGRELLAYGVHTLRNGERPYDLIGQARSVVLGYIERFGPAVVAIEKPYQISERRAELLSTLVQELEGRARELGLAVQQLSPEEVRERVNRNPTATKIEVAEALVRNGFGQLAGLVPRRPKRAALGLRPRDKYWLHMFDALGIAIAVRVQNTPKWRLEGRA